MSGYYWQGLGPTMSPGFKLGRTRGVFGLGGSPLRGMEEELAKLDSAQAGLNVGSALDVVKGILGQGTTAGQTLTQSLTALTAGDVARERTRTVKLVGGVLGAAAVIGLGIWGLSKLSKR